MPDVYSEPPPLILSFSQTHLNYAIFPMNLYFIPNDPEQTTLVSGSGVPQYTVSTTKSSGFRKPVVTKICRPTETAADNVIGEVEWRKWGAHPVVRSNVFDGTDQIIEVRELLYKLGSTFSTARFFLGNDNEEYRWKFAKGKGYVLTQRSSGVEIARFMEELVPEGFFRGERKWGLHIRPSNLDIDIIVLTFIILEKRRRDHAAAVKEFDHDNAEEPCEGGIEVGGL